MVLDRASVSAEAASGPGVDSTRSDQAANASEVSRATCAQVCRSSIGTVRNCSRSCASSRSACAHSSGAGVAFSRPRAAGRQPRAAAVHSRSTASEPEPAPVSPASCGCHSPRSRGRVRSLPSDPPPYRPAAPPVPAWPPPSTRRQPAQKLRQPPQRRRGSHRRTASDQQPVLPDPAHELVFGLASHGTGPHLAAQLEPRLARSSKVLVSLVDELLPVGRGEGPPVPQRRRRRLELGSFAAHSGTR